MNTVNFVCTCMGIDGDVIDKLCDDFDLDIEDNDVYDALKTLNPKDRWAPARHILGVLLDQIIDKYPQLDRSKFTSDFSSPSYPDMYYDGERFDSKKELDRIANREDSDNPEPVDHSNDVVVLTVVDADCIKRVIKVFGKEPTSDDLMAAIKEYIERPDICIAEEFEDNDDLLDLCEELEQEWTARHQDCYDYALEWVPILMND